MIGILSTIFLYFSGAYFLLSYLAKRSIHEYKRLLASGNIMSLCHETLTHGVNGEWRLTWYDN